MGTNETEFPGEDSYTAPADEGVDGGADEMSIFDGAGNETVVAMADDESGRRAQGTGATREEALADAQSGDDLLGEGFNPRSGA